MWGNVFGKIFDWLPGRRESYRNKIEEIEREMDSLIRQGLSGSRADKYERLAQRLRDIRRKAKNT